jgi:MFS family permease
VIRQTFAPLRHPAFRLLLIGRTVNTLGNTFAPIALAFAVLDLTGSASDLGLVVGTRTIVNVLFLLFGGVLADRLPRHLLMVGASVLAAVTQSTIATLVLTDAATMPALIALSAVNGMVAAVALPASAAILPQTVPADERQQANALNRLFFNAAAVVGAPVAGVVVATVGPGWGIMVDAATFVVAAGAFAFLRVPEPAATKSAAASAASAPDATPAAAYAAAAPDFAPAASGTAPETERPAVAAPIPDARKGVFADLLTGWGEFRSRTWLWAVVAGFCVLNASWSGAVNVLGPTVADQTIGRRAWGLVLAAQTVGMIIGALVAMRLRLHRMLFFGTACTGLLALPMLVLGAAPRVGLLVPAAFVAGLGLEQFGVAWETTMQEHIPADKLARVYSYDMVGSFIAIPIGEIVAGPVAEMAGIEATLVGAGMLVILSVAGMLSSRDVRHLRHRLPERRTTPMEELAA